jgi:hypothetical protein
VNRYLHHPVGAAPVDTSTAVVWFGPSTRHWWAMIWCGRWRLVEAHSPTELAEAIDGALTWPWPKPWP